MLLISVSILVIFITFMNLMRNLNFRSYSGMEGMVLTMAFSTFFGLTIGFTTIIIIKDLFSAFLFAMVLSIAIGFIYGKKFSSIGQVEGMISGVMAAMMATMMGAMLSIHEQIITLIIFLFMLTIASYLVVIKKRVHD
ncbi:hypothetical protein CEY16_10285 [Halalkalibacillus sediminis]|uniref:Uncharacterized protein n=1 Tax=Halalkalibacillus sediminis TaxID=2018042 RepID=A0A2I0QRZ9_9BACI|nr:hypothetical protein [Halalkalibacillus sediminis]PKR77125.1 hypothetical protein CEY16_10285 [Halalkalibacillus sediminis]